MNHKERLGKQIVKLRKAKGLSQKDLAERLHISFQAISKWERGVSLPDLDTLQKLCDILGISFQYFLFDAYSTMSLDELILSINSTGITSKNYRSVGALIRSNAFDSVLKATITDPIFEQVFETIRNTYDSFKTNTDLMQDHIIIRKYSDYLDLNILFTSDVINNVTFKYAVLTPTYDNMIYAKSLTRFVENTMNELYLLILADEHNMEFKSVCSKNLIEQGMNCYFITDLALRANIKQNLLGGISGGGQQGHAGFHTEAINIKDNYIQNTLRIVKEYLKTYDRDFEIAIF